MVEADNLFLYLQPRPSDQGPDVGSSNLPRSTMEGQRAGGLAEVRDRDGPARGAREPREQRVASLRQRNGAPGGEVRVKAEGGRSPDRMFPRLAEACVFADDRRMERADQASRRRSNASPGSSRSGTPAAASYSPRREQLHQPGGPAAAGMAPGHGPAQRQGATPSGPRRRVSFGDGLTGREWRAVRPRQPGGVLANLAAMGEMVRRPHSDIPFRPAYDRLMGRRRPRSRPSSPLPHPFRETWEEPGQGAQPRRGEPEGGLDRAPREELGATSSPGTAASPPGLPTGEDTPEDSLPSLVEDTTPDRGDGQGEPGDDGEGGVSPPRMEGPGPLTVAELIRQAEEALRSLRERQAVFIQERLEHGEDNDGSRDEGDDPLGGTKSEELD